MKIGSPIAMRQFIRHPVTIPIQVHPIDHPTASITVQSLSTGGLCFETDTPVAIGSLVEFVIPNIEPEYHGDGVIVWRKEQSPNHYCVGLCFITDDEYYRTRMVEQVCRIEIYRKSVAAMGRELSAEAAAQEWIAQFAAKFDDSNIIN
jgi:PilZ domain